MVDKLFYASLILAAFCAACAMGTWMVVEDSQRRPPLGLAWMFTIGVPVFAIAAVFLHG